VVYCRFALTRIRHVQNEVQQTFVAMQSAIETTGKLNVSPLSTGTNNSTNLVANAVTCSLKNRLDLSEIHIGLALSDLRPSSKWFQVQNLATEFGMLFTVIGTSLAFARVPTMTKPTDILVAMQLALLTTVVGLLLKIATLFFCSNPIDFAIEQLSDRIWKGVTIISISLSSKPAKEKDLEKPHA